MPPVTEADTAETILVTVRTLDAESQRAVLSYALFLQHQRSSNGLTTDEAQWERLAGQPDKMARFAEWAQQSLAEHPPEPFDIDRL